MANPYSPNTPPPRKRGWGCLGCGCLIVILLILLFCGFVGGIGYLAYTNISEITTRQAPAIPTFDGGDTVYNTAHDKLDAFDRNLKNRGPASLRLSADEINTLIARTPAYSALGLHAFVTMTGDQAEVQFSCPTSFFPLLFMPDRYIGGKVAFKVHLDTNQKMLVFDPISLQFGKKILLGPGSSYSSASNQAFMQAIIPAFNQAIQKQMQQDPEGQDLLNRARTLEIKNGELVIEVP